MIHCAIIDLASIWQTAWINAGSPTLSFNDKGSIPNVYVLDQNYPNPFNPMTILRYDLPKDALVNITIYDMMGRQVKTLINDQISLRSYNSSCPTTAPSRGRRLLFEYKPKFRRSLAWYKNEWRRKLTEEDESCDTFVDIASENQTALEELQVNHIAKCFFGKSDLHIFV